MKNKKKILMTGLSLLMVLGLAACNKPKEEEKKPAEVKQDKQLEEYIKKTTEKKETRQFNLELDDFDKDNSTPFIIRIEHEGQNYYEPAKLVSQDNKYYRFEVPTFTKEDKMHLFVPAINSEKSKYITYELLDADLNEKGLARLEPVDKSEIRPESTEQIVNTTKLAFELDCSSIDEKAKNEIIDKQYNTLKAVETNPEEDEKTKEDDKKDDKKEEFTKEELIEEPVKKSKGQD